MDSSVLYLLGLGAIRLKKGFSYYPFFKINREGEEREGIPKGLKKYSQKERFLNHGSHYHRHSLIGSSLFSAVSMRLS